MITADGRIARLDVRKQVFKNEVKMVKIHANELIHASYESLYYISRFKDYFEDYQAIIEISNNILYSMREVNIIVGIPAIIENVKVIVQEMVDEDIEADNGIYKPTYLRNRYGFISDTIRTMEYSHWFHAHCGGAKFTEDILRVCDVMNAYLPVGNKFYINKTDEDYKQIANEIYYLL